MSVLLSIHDVTPAWRSHVDELWALCRARHATPALLVVPQWHGEWPLESHPDYVAWVRARAADGAELFLHGERHDEVGSPRGLRDQWHALGRTDREGEFLTLDHDAARVRIARGLARFHALGLHAIGFVPPAWLCRDGTRTACQSLDLPLLEDAGTVHLLAEGRALASPVLRWSGRTTLRARGSAVQAAWRWRTQRNAPCFRIALHPMDLEHPVTRQSVIDELDRWLAHRPAAPYASLLTPTRAGAPAQRVPTGS
ncbi:MAG: polysaccharide deacetylase family protein [Gemmatimonadaceae bacterium]|nr:polysaccharide deacetylase family protein [Gemmatimonadaceae bacterium]